MSKYQITIDRHARIAVVRTLEEHGRGRPNMSLFHGASRQVIPLDRQAA
jgi:hypothetical protein